MSLFYKNSVSQIIDSEQADSYFSFRSQIWPNVMRNSEKYFKWFQQ